MLRKIKLLLFAALTIAMVGIFALLFNSYATDSIPNTANSIMVVAWDNKQSKRKIFSQMTKLANDENISLMKARFNDLNGHNSKAIYEFNSDKNATGSFYLNEQTKRLDKQALQLEAVIGYYYTSARGATLEKVFSKFKKLGLKIMAADTALTPKRLFMMVTGSFSEAIIFAFISLLGILLIVMLLEKIYRFKTFAVMKINGYSNWQIIRHGLLKELLPLGATDLVLIGLAFFWSILQLTASGIRLFMLYTIVIIFSLSVIFLVLDLISYLALKLIDIYAAIKGQTNTKQLLVIGYLLKIAVMILLTMNTVALVNGVKDYQMDQIAIKLWNNQQTNYDLSLFWDNEDPDAPNVKETNEVGKAVHRLAIENQAILARNSQNLQPKINDTDPDYGNLMYVNSTYLKKNSIKLTNNTNYTLPKMSKNNVVLLVPEDRMFQLAKFKKQLLDFINFQRSLPNYYSVHGSIKLKVVPIKSKQIIYNYQLLAVMQDTVSVDPILVIVNDRLLSDNFYLATASQGLLRFTDLTNLRKSIKRLGLTNNVVGISNQKVQLSDYKTQTKQKFSVLIIAVLVSVIQLVFIEIFISSSFLQRCRRKMAVNAIFGRSNLKLINMFLLGNLLLDLLVMIIVLQIGHGLSNIPIMLVFLLLETIVILFTCWRGQKNLLTTLNHGN
ncbi:hypothetical protein OZX56_05920 [Lactobacillus sp. ESL0684]|uniref:hypothetical protein n=1 Tax=Lactobacillus sp. ESL0684 TaxID=2983213 RepID=UPI0023F6FBA8|nr:hypothetical protein [Lactobacillus sp. ESL0684]WEV43083.1 hypothetical protein OZX56_05920 [Lactobacillus sp. ESL0684]